MRLVTHNLNGEVHTDRFQDAVSAIFVKGALLLRNKDSAVIASFPAANVIKVRSIELNTLKAEQVARGLETMAEIETLKRQLQEARNALEITRDMAKRALDGRERGASITVEAVSDIWRAAMIGAHRASDEFKPKV